MARSLRDQEGYFLIDHRNSPGFDEETALKHGLPKKAGRGQFEAPSFVCSHCEAICIVSPQRNQEIPYCPKCDHHICRPCEGRRAASGGQCMPVKAVIDQMMEKAAKSGVR